MTRTRVLPRRAAQPKAPRCLQQHGWAWRLARSHKDTNHFCMKSLKNDTDGQNTDSDLKDMVINGERREG